jgi:hypothetical protein
MEVRETEDVNQNIFREEEQIKMESTERKENGELCVLCQGVISNEETIIKTSCGHSFHAIKGNTCQGLYRHLLMNRNCPLCRKDLISKEQLSQLYGKESELHIPNSSREFLSSGLNQRQIDIAKKKLTCAACCIILLLIIVIGSTLGATLKS